MKSLRPFIFVLVAFCTLSATPSHAAIGRLTKSSKVTIAGAVLSGFGILAASSSKNAGDVGTAFSMALLGVGAVVLGLVVLDGEKGQELAFSTLTINEATKLNISKEEMKSFNAEIDQVNALTSFVDAETELLKNADAEDAAKIWDDVKPSVTPETFSALAKISRQLYK